VERRAVGQAAGGGVVEGGREPVEHGLAPRRGDRLVVLDLAGPLRQQPVHVGGTGRGHPGAGASEVVERDLRLVAVEAGREHRVAHEGA
jgi:hypothetical protein